jgi:cell division protein FtsB
MRIRRAAWPLLISAIVVGILALAAFPARTYVAQRRGLVAADRRVAVLREQNASMSKRVARLDTDAEIERLARRQYSLVRPGEEAYAILPPPEAPPARPEARPAPKGRPGFWSRLWRAL